MVQHPTTGGVTGSYEVVGGSSNTIEFTTAPATGVDIQIRHIGFAGATSSAVTGFYGRTGNVALNSTDDITTGDIAARNLNISGISTFADDIKVGTGVTIEKNGNARFTGIVTFGTTSTTIYGHADTIRVGTALTLGHTEGLVYHTQNLHSAGFEVNQINASGIRHCITI